MAAELGTGASISFTGFSGEITSISWGGIAAETIDASHLGSTAWKAFIAGDLADPGEITVEGHFEGTVPTVGGAAATLTITLGNTGATTIAASAFCTGFDFDIPLEDKMTFTATFKATGAITVTP